MIIETPFPFSAGFAPGGVGENTPTFILSRGIVVLSSYPLIVQLTLFDGMVRSG